MPVYPFAHMMPSCWIHNSGEIQLKITFDDLSNQNPGYGIILFPPGQVADWGQGVQSILGSKEYVPRVQGSHIPEVEI